MAWVKLKQVEMCCEADVGILPPTGSFFTIALRSTHQRWPPVRVAKLYSKSIACLRLRVVKNGICNQGVNLCTNRAR